MTAQLLHKVGELVKQMRQQAQTPRFPRDQLLHQPLQTDDRGDLALIVGRWVTPFEAVRRPRVASTARALSTWLTISPIFKHYRPIRYGRRPMYGSDLLFWIR